MRSGSRCRRPGLHWPLLLFVSLTAGASPARAPGVRVRQQKRGRQAWEHASPQAAASLASVGSTRLLIHAVADSTLHKYLPAVRKFLEQMEEQDELLRSAKEIDWALAKHLDSMCYQLEKGYNAASALYSGMTSLFPELRDALPLSARSLMAWQRLDVPGEGGPIAPAAIWVIIAAFTGGDRQTAEVACRSQAREPCNRDRRATTE